MAIKQKGLMEEEDFRGWRGLPTTRKFLQFLKDYRDQLAEGWLDGQYQRDDPVKYAMQDSDAVARAQCYNDLAEIQYSFMEAFYLKDEIEEPSDAG